MPIYPPSLSPPPPLFTSPQPATTLVLSVRSYLERLESDLHALRFAVEAGHRLHVSDDLPPSPSHASAVALEQARIDARAWNHENVTELEESFRPIPLGDGRDGIPVTGQWLRGLSRMYILPLPPSSLVQTLVREDCVGWGLMAGVTG